MDFPRLENGSFNCRQAGVLIVADQRDVLHSPPIILMLGILVLCSRYYNPQDSDKSFWGRANHGVAA